ncbi:hypothetical protein A134_00495 [Vibrio crassostreae 9CS106]|nr:hypothetical protein A134_00495 [Vibrio crassostreae 9CS106]
MVLVVFLYGVPKLIFNVDGSPLGGFDANLTLFINAIGTLFVLFVIVSRDKRAQYFPKSKFYLIAIIYYLIALMSSFYSGLPLISSYNAIVGGLFVFSASAIAKHVNKEGNIFDNYQWFLSFLLKFTIAGILINILFYYIYFGKSDFLKHGIGADFSAALLLFVAISNMHIKNGFLPKFLFFLALILSLRLNSFSSLLSVSVGYVVFLLYNKNFIRFSIVVLCSILTITLFYTFLLDNSGSGLIINNKPANAYLTGSGRFDYYLTAFDVIKNFDFFKFIFGTGFMAERLLMDGFGLSWITDPHNSALLSFLGMGTMGFFLYLSFCIYPYIKVLYMKKSGLEAHWIFFHTTFIAYGFTSSYYLGRPTVILIFSLLLTSIITLKEQQE